MNVVLILARGLAFGGRKEDVVAVLDVAERFPRLMLDPEDRTREFREQLVTLALRNHAFAHAVTRFDRGG